MNHRSIKLMCMTAVILMVLYSLNHRYYFAKHNSSVGHLIDNWTGRTWYIRGDGYEPVQPIEEK